MGYSDDWNIFSKRRADDSKFLEIIKIGMNLQSGKI